VKTLRIHSDQIKDHRSATSATDPPSMKGPLWCREQSMSAGQSYCTLRRTKALFPIPPFLNLFVLNFSRIVFLLCSSSGSTQNEPCHSNISYIAITFHPNDTDTIAILHTFRAAPVGCRFIPIDFPSCIQIHYCTSTIVSNLS